MTDVPQHNIFYTFSILLDEVKTSNPIDLFELIIKNSNNDR